MKNDLAGLREITETSSDQEMKQLAYGEMEEAKAELRTLEEELKAFLIPKDPNDSKNVIVEIRAGTGGDEAALFAADLFRMYSRYAEKQGWKVDVLDLNDTGIGGIKEMSFGLSGKDVYGSMKFESGVHRVQRVPEDRDAGAGPYVRCDSRGSAGGGTGGRRDQSGRPGDRHVPVRREGRPERQQGRDRRSDHAQAVRNHRRLPSGTLAIPESRAGHEDAPGEAV